jgi:hypothetical protein
MVSNLLPKSNNHFSISSGEGLGDNCGGGLLFLMFNSGEGLVILGAFSNHIKVVGPTLVMISILDCIPFIRDRYMEGDSRG